MASRFRNKIMPSNRDPYTYGETMIDANIGMLEVVVTEDQWYAYGDQTPSSEEAYSILVAQGGINETVPPGTYTYTIERIDNDRVLASLHPKDDRL